MPDILGYWDRRTDDHHYEFTDDSGDAWYKYCGKIMKYDKYQKAIEKQESQKEKRKNAKNLLRKL